MQPVQAEYTPDGGIPECDAYKIEFYDCYVRLRLNLMSMSWFVERERSHSPHRHSEQPYLPRQLTIGLNCRQLANFRKAEATKKQPVAPVSRPAVVWASSPAPVSSPVGRQHRWGTTLLILFIKRFIAI
jgi:hypothetical protein